MTETKTPLPGSMPIEDSLPGGSTPFEDSSLLDLDDPNITGTLFEGFNDDSAELLISGVVPAFAPPQHPFAEPAPPEDSESSFAQLWASAVTDDEAQTQFHPESQHPTSDYFAAWQEAAERHHLPAAVELLPPVIQQEEEDEEDASSLPPTGFFSPEDAPLFFVNEQWSPAAVPQPVSQNPLEESVAVLGELSFQNAFQAPMEDFGPSADSSPYASSVSYLSLAPPEITPPLFSPKTPPPLPPPPSLSPAPHIAGHPNSPSVLQNNLWLVDASEDLAALQPSIAAFPAEEGDDIILLEDELPPETDENEILHFGVSLSPSSAQDFSLFEAPPSQSFPPKIPPVAAPDTPSLLTPAIFYDDEGSQWPQPPKNIPQLFHTPSPRSAKGFQIPGLHKVVLYTMGGAVKRGAFENPDLSQPSVSLRAHEETELLAVEQIKAVYFMKPSTRTPAENSPFPPPGGSYWKVVFHDGRRVEGQLSELQGTAGFFLIPKQGKSPTAYLYVNRSAVQEMSSLTA
ncbi:MAG: hypothetical protein FWD46_07450 [Cystobacterineae bacterium]|nr:hypothetical protein [Cystobacterineae bacterium]